MNVLVLMDMQEKLYNEDKHSKEIEETKAQSLEKLKKFEGIIITTKQKVTEVTAQDKINDEVSLVLKDMSNVLYVDKAKCGKKEIGEIISKFDNVKNITVMGLYKDIFRTIAVDILVVIDMQYDFLYGALRNEAAIAIEQDVVDVIEKFDGFVIVTRDTHHENYLETQEGQILPIIHCVENTPGHKITTKVQEALDKKPNVKYLNKESFGSKEIGPLIEKFAEIGTITVIGVCTDICVITNVMVIKTFNPEAKLIVLKDCCAGVTFDSHTIAILAMQGCQTFINKKVG